MKKVSLFCGLILRSKEVRPLSNRIPDCSCGSHSSKSLLMKKYFRWETWYISEKRSKELSPPFLNWMHFTKQAIPMMPGHWAEFPWAAGCSCSFYQKCSLFHKNTHKTSVWIPLTRPGHLAGADWPQGESVLLLHLDFLCCSFPEWRRNKMPWR